MKVLYATYRYDPQNPDLGSGLDYECYHAFLRAGFETPIVGPVTDTLSLLERFEYGFWRWYKKLTGKGGLKFPLTTAWRSSSMLDHAIQTHKPDVVFSVFPPFFVFGHLKTPCVWYFDTTFLGQEPEWPLYGRLPLALSVWEEKKALKDLTRVVTMSQWSKDILAHQYGVPAGHIEIVPLFAALPAGIIPDYVDVEKEKHLETPLRILLVGRVYERKGIDIAIEIVRQLNEQGQPAHLTVCGFNEGIANAPFVTFVGPYSKSDPTQLRDYIGWYKWAHILLHPARFEAAGIVPSEAAAFGTPTITNDTGGLATTVQHGESGIVLPRKSPPEAYVQAIRELMAQPERYYALCRSTRQRYEKVLNSQVAGERLVQILQDAVAQSRYDRMAF